MVSDWNAFYDENETQIEQIYPKGENSNPRTFVKGNIYIRNSLFEFIEAQTYGGGIFFNSTETCWSVLIETSQFANCKAQISGGAIYINGADAVLYRVCGFDCKVLQIEDKYSDGNFYNIYAPDTYKSNDFVIESQISHCSSNFYGYTLSLHHGHCQFDYSNVSLNYVIRCSCFRMQSTDGYDGSVSFSSFYNNTATSTICMQFYQGDSDVFYTLNYSNIIYNSQEGNELGFFFIPSPCKFINDCILGNKCPEQSYLFYISNHATVTILNCTLTEDQKKSNIESSLNIESIPEESFINALHLLSTGKCFGTFDEVGELKPDFIKTPVFLNPSKNVYMTCKRTLKSLKTAVFLGSTMFSQ